MRSQNRMVCPDRLRIVIKMRALKLLAMVGKNNSSNFKTRESDDPCLESIEGVDWDRMVWFRCR